MKGFHKNSRRIENEVFILYMPDHELVTASNLQKNPNCFEPDHELVTASNLQKKSQLFRTFYFWNGIFTESP